MSVFSQTATFGSSYGLFTWGVGRAEEQGAGWSVKSQWDWDGSRKPLIRAGEVGRRRQAREAEFAGLLQNP